MKCRNCGSTAFTKAGGDYICDYCGVKITPEEAKRLSVSGTVEVTRGDAEKERLLKNIDTYPRLSDTEKAESVSLRLIEEYPDDYRSWLSLARVRSRDFRKPDIPAKEFAQVAKFLTNAKECAPTPEIRDEIIEIHLKYDKLHTEFVNRKKQELAVLRQQNQALDQEISVKKAELAVLEKKRKRTDWLIGSLGVSMWFVGVAAFVSLLMLIFTAVESGEVNPAYFLSHHMGNFLTVLITWTVLIVGVIVLIVSNKRDKKEKAVIDGKKGEIAALEGRKTHINKIHEINSYINAAP